MTSLRAFPRARQHARPAAARRYPRTTRAPGRRALPPICCTKSGVDETHQIRGYGAKPARLRLARTAVPLSALHGPVRFEGEAVKRILMLTVLGMLAVAL